MAGSHGFFSGMIETCRIRIRHRDCNRLWKGIGSKEGRKDFYVEVRLATGTRGKVGPVECTVRQSVPAFRTWKPRGHVLLPDHAGVADAIVQTTLFAIERGNNVPDAQCEDIEQF